MIEEICQFIYFNLTIFFRNWKKKCSRFWKLSIRDEKNYGASSSFIRAAVCGVFHTFFNSLACSMCTRTAKLHSRGLSFSKFTQANFQFEASLSSKIYTMKFGIIPQFSLVGILRFKVVFIKGQNFWFKFKTVSKNRLYSTRFHRCLFQIKNCVCNANLSLFSWWLSDLI